MLCISGYIVVREFFYVFSKFEGRVDIISIIFILDMKIGILRGYVICLNGRVGV